MSILNNKMKAHPIGIWMALGALVLILLAWLMQTYSLLDWEGAVKLGVQNESFSGNAVERAIADVERGVAIADIIWVLPLTVVAFIGLLRTKFTGFVAANMVFAICVYFPLFYAFRVSMNFDVKLAAIFLWAIPSLLGIIGLWTNRNIFKYR
ncbi:MAG: hypothetical protein DRI75_13345 [Bacteroidetes bacterium]|nr:MAG: hypothetical protein DRI75_13345 [Bacteroidota bacterium]